MSHTPGLWGLAPRTRMYWTGWAESGSLSETAPPALVILRFCLLTPALMGDICLTLAWRPGEMAISSQRARLARCASGGNMTFCWTDPFTVAVWFEDLPLDARLECCYGPSNHPRAMGLWFPRLAADAKLQIIVGPAPAGPCMGIWRGTVLDW